MAHGFHGSSSTQIQVSLGAGATQGIGVPYWPIEEGSSHGERDPDPLPASDLPPPLVSLDAFLRNASNRDSGDGQGIQGNGELEGSGEEDMIDFEPTSFDHPVYIMFSSGTTGLPKCMVHGAGGTCMIGLFFANFGTWTSNAFPAIPVPVLDTPPDAFLDCFPAGIGVPNGACCVDLNHLSRGVNIVQSFNFVSGLDTGSKVVEGKQVQRR